MDEFRTYWRDSTIEDLDELYWKFFRRPWSEVFRAYEPDEAC